MRLLLALALLPGCGIIGGNYLSRDLACEHDVYSWWGGMTQNVYYGDKNGDTIDWAYPPYEGWITRKLGNYDTVTGDYTARQQFHPEHYMESYVAVGFGTVFEDGDLDIGDVVTEKDILGEEIKYQRRHRREGCSGSIRTIWDQGTEGTDTIVEYVIQSPTQVQLSTSITDDAFTGSYNQLRTIDSDFNVTGETTQTWEGGNSASTFTQDIDLNYSSDWSQSTTEFDYFGSSTSDLTGRSTSDYEVYEGETLRAHITYNRAYDGSGSGTYDDFGQDLSCTVVYRSNGNCTYDCGADGTFDETGC